MSASLRTHTGKQNSVVGMHPLAAGIKNLIRTSVTPIPIPFQIQTKDLYWDLVKIIFILHTVCDSVEDHVKKGPLRSLLKSIADFLCKLNTVFI